MAIISTILFLALPIGTCGLAIIRGGFAERVVASIVALSVPVGFAVMQLPADAQPVTELVADGVIAFAVLALAVFLATPWLGAVLLLYAGQFALHAFYFVSSRPVDKPYALLNNAIFLAVTISLLVGTVGTLRKRASCRRPAIRPPAAAADPA